MEKYERGNREWTEKYLGLEKKIGEYREENGKLVEKISVLS